MGFIYLFIYFKDFIFWERGREGEIERNINAREKHQSAASHRCPDRGLDLQPRRVPWAGLKSATHHFVGCHPINLAILVKAQEPFWTYAFYLYQIQHQVLSILLWKFPSNYNTLHLSLLISTATTLGQTVLSLLDHSLRLSVTLEKKIFFFKKQS